MSNINAVLKPKLSIKNPYAGGIIAPPTIAIHNNPEACGFKSPNPCNVSVKMVGNMIELNSPTASIETIAVTPIEFIEITNMLMANTAKTFNTFAGCQILVR